MSGFMAGPYLAVYNAKVCGQTQDGITFDRQVFKRMVTGDWFGDAPQDAIYRGTDLTSMATFLNAQAAGVLDMIRPYQGGNAAGSIHGGFVGLMDVKHGITRSLVLTSLLTAAIINQNGVSGGTTIVPLTRTLPRTVLAENYPIREALNSNLRDVPIKFRHYPSQWVQGETMTLGGEFGTDT